MQKQSFNSKETLESNAVAKLVQTASKFTSVVLLNKGEKTANAKSIMGIISLNIKQGESVTITAEGLDEINVIPSMEMFFI